jgi:hypothetical protein
MAYDVPAVLQQHREPRPRPKLTIGICTLIARKAMFERLRAHIVRQIVAAKAVADVELLSECDAGALSVGAKRQRILDKARGEYICYVDDDDWVDDYYIAILLQTLHSHNVDCIGMAGRYSSDGAHHRAWRISRQYERDVIEDGVYVRRPNHLVPIRIEHARAAGFPDLNRGEDGAYSDRLQELRLLRTEYFIPRALYHYQFSTTGTATQQEENE